MTTQQSTEARGKARIEMENITKSFDTPEGGELTVLDNLDVTLESGSFTTIMGPSGCGKSTLLNILAGILPMDSGTIRLNGDDISPSEIFYGYIFQEPRLLNWLTVGENIKFALKARGVSTAEHDDRIDHELQRVGLADVRNKYPLQLSGGMRQRVGIARALAIDPDLILMDEPFSSLDEITARQLQEDVTKLWQETEKTILFVTHDITEAVFLSDRIIFLDGNGNVFNRAEINIPRPRSFEGSELLERESELMEEFFDRIEE